MTEAKRSETPMDKVWKLFVSLRLAIVVIIILAAASIIGTLIEQNQPLEKYRQVYGDGTIRLFEALSFFDMYHSWWFLLLVPLLVVPPPARPADREPHVLHARPAAPGRQGGTKPEADPRREPRKEPGAFGPLEEEGFHGKVGRIVRGRHGGIFSQAGNDRKQRYAPSVRGERGRFPLRCLRDPRLHHHHLPRGDHRNIVEGQSVREVPTRGGSGKVDLGFEVRCNKFWVDYYPTGQPKEYASDLSVIENGVEIVRKKIVVNDPLQYKGIWFYQSSYGQAGATSAMVTVNKANGGTVANVKLTPGQKAEVQGYGTISAVDYQPNFQGFGPGLRVVLEKPGKPPADFWLLRAHPEFDRQRKDTHFLSFSGLNEVFYTGLQVAKDPGVNIVWVGCGLMVIGTLIAFFMSHQRVWVRLSPAQDGRVDVVLAGSTNRNRLAFEKKFEKIQADIKAVTS
jgi:cytochrome c biogenesis protein